MELITRGMEPVNGILRAQENLRSFCMIQPFLGRVKPLASFYEVHGDALVCNKTDGANRHDMPTRGSETRNTYTSRYLKMDLSDLSPRL